MVRVVMMALVRWDDRGGGMNHEEADQNVAKRTTGNFYGGVRRWASKSDEWLGIECTFLTSTEPNLYLVNYTTNSSLLFLLYVPDLKLFQSFYCETITNKRLYLFNTSENFFVFSSAMKFIWNEHRMSFSSLLKTDLVLLYVENLTWQLINGDHVDKPRLTPDPSTKISCLCSQPLQSPFYHGNVVQSVRRTLLLG